jgi:L-lysine exporter family protein LysE/ArgO
VAVSLGNPHAIVDTIGVIGSGSLAYEGSAKAAFTLACISVSWLWFFGLAVAGRALSGIDTARRLLNRVSAVVMWVSAAYMASTLLP